VGTTNACSAAVDLDVGVDLARVERTLLSVAFDIDLDLDLDFDLASALSMPPGKARPGRHDFQFLSLP